MADCTANSLESPETVNIPPQLFTGSGGYRNPTLC